MDIGAAHTERIDIWQAMMPQIITIAAAARRSGADGEAKFRPTLLDEMEDRFNRLRHGFRLAGEMAMEFSGITISVRQVLNKLIQLAEYPAFIFHHPRADVEAQDGEIRHDIQRTAAFDFARVNGNAFALAIEGEDGLRQFGQCGDRIAPLLRVAPGMGGFAVDDQGEIATAFAGAGESAGS